MTEPITVRQALLLRLSGALDSEARTAKALAATGLAPGLVVVDLRGAEPVTPDGARALYGFARTQAEQGVRCRAVVDPAGPAAQVLLDAGPPDLLPLFGDADHALTGEGDPGEAGTLVSQLETLTRAVLGETTVAAALEQIVKAAAIVVPNADMVSVTVRTAQGEFHTPALSSEVAAELDQVQYRAGRGPCVDSARPDGPGYVVSENLAEEPRWPEFAAAAAGHGYVSVLATELHQATGAAQLSGALNVYSRRQQGLTDTDRHVSLLLATHASLALAHTHGTELADLHEARLRSAISTRDVIGQAKGILMNRQGITAEEAFDLLRTTSQALNVKLVDVARTLANRHQELDIVSPADG